MERCLKVQNLFLNSKLNSTETHGKKVKFSSILHFPTLHGPTGVNKSAYHGQLHCGPKKKHTTLKPLKVNFYVFQMPYILKCNKYRVICD